jgi:hypothetical protein
MKVGEEGKRERESIEAIGLYKVYRVDGGRGG